MERTFRITFSPEAVLYALLALNPRSQLVTPLAYRWAMPLRMLATSEHLKVTNVDARWVEARMMDDEAVRNSSYFGCPREPMLQ